uniref:B30.2/SPRY domain-containing protein n=1 Tax=Sphenodon punctatus TaxID=8508 RepID=A0A8D0GAD3_SPHPU
MLIEQVNVTLDPDTAHPELNLSEDRKSMRRGDKWKDLPDNPERFDANCCVLGCEGFTTGRRYWEVEVGDNRYWAVGVARESVRRKGKSNFSPEDGIWAVERWGDKYRVCTSHLSPSSHLKRILVFLDCTEGQVTIFDAETGASIFTFPPASFTQERIRPWFLVGTLTGSSIRLCL